MRHTRFATAAVAVLGSIIMIVGASCSRNEKIVTAAEIGSALPGVPGATAATPVRAADKIYTACNLWYEKPERMDTINYKVGAMIPAGTEVRDIRIVGGRHPKIVFNCASDGMEFHMQHRLPFHASIPASQYVDRLFTKANFEELTTGMTDAEIDAIKSGQLVVGMSKKAVIVCYGYPPEHRTPSLESNQWLYWMNRFRTKAVDFDQDNRTVRSATGDPNAL